MATTTTDKIFVGNIGTILQVTIKEKGLIVDISAATLKQLVVVDPSGTRNVHTAAFLTDGTDGKLQYATVSGDLPIPGEYHIQAILVLTTWSGKSSIGKFPVMENL